MSLLDVYNLLGCGIVVAFLAVIAGIMWERRVRQNIINKAKITKPSAAILSHSERGKNESRGPSSSLSKRILQTSEKISSGSPSVYKPSMEIEFRRKDSMVARQSIGGGPSHHIGGRTEKVLMLVGARGTGKTTLINAMVNYILGVEWKDDFRYKLDSEDATPSHCHSQTKDIAAYTIYPMEGSTVPYTFTIIDTPGFGDSDSPEKDRAVIDQIKEFLSIPPPDGIDHLDGIGFVTQASLARFTLGQEYIFDSILSIFGKDVSKIIFMMLTFADRQQLPLLEVIDKAGVPSDKYFKFNNSALFVGNSKESKETMNAMFWKMGTHSFKSFFAELAKTESISLQLAKEVWKERKKAPTLIVQLNQQITMGRRRIDQLRQEERVLEQHKKEIEVNKNYTYTCQVTKARQIDLSVTGMYAMTCLKCNFTCHKNCTVGDEGDKLTCDAFAKTGFCNVCAGHCHWSNHKSLPYIIEYVTVNETKTLEDMKRKYDKAVSLKSQVDCTIKQLNDDVQNMETDIITTKNQIQQSLHRLDEISLKPDPLTQKQYLERLIESAKLEAKPGWKQCVQYYEEAKRQAEIWPSMKDVDVRKMIEDAVSRKEECTTTYSHPELQIDEGIRREPGTNLHRPPPRLAERILQISKKVSCGSPSVYKLPTKVELKRTKGMIVRKSIGSPTHRVGGGTEKVLMVVGATGAGKTTLINGMVNYILGVQWKDDFRYKLVIEDDQVSQANSQTKDITAYTFYPMEGSAVPYTFTIIDTPGFGDTEGLERDRQITDQIKEFFSIPPPDGIDHLDGIGFVTQASLARLTPTQEYIFDSILSIFGKDVVKNIFMLVTFADGQAPPVMEAIKKANIPSQKYYKFNNSALFAENTEDAEESFDAMFWKMVVRSFKNFFAEFEKSQSVSLQLTQEVLKEREQLQNLIEGLNPQITMGLGKIEEMRQEENVLKQRETEIETNKSFTYEVEVTKPREIDLRGKGKHTTTCIRCNFTCHKDCAYGDNNDKLRCCAMGSGGYCTVCTGNCHWTEHRNLPYLIEYEKVTEVRTSDDLKKKYETAVSGKDKVKSMIDQLEDYLINVHTNVLRMIVKAQQSLRRLDQIALKPNPLTQVQYLELLIESEKNEAKPGWQKRVHYYEEAKRQAKMLSKVKDVKAAEKQIQEKAASGDKWYSRFKFW